MDVEEKLKELSQRIAEVDTKWAMDNKTMINYIKITNQVLEELKILKTRGITK